MKIRLTLVFLAALLFSILADAQKLPKNVGSASKVEVVIENTERQLAKG